MVSRFITTRPNAPPSPSTVFGFKTFLVSAAAAVVLPSSDELDVYLREPCVEMVGGWGQFRALDWWMEGAQQARFPNLAKLAVDMLSIPALSAGIESTFSKCRATLADNRNKISPDTLQDLQLLRL